MERSSINTLDFDSFPDDVKTKILCGVPVKTLCVLKCVSKALNTQIKSPVFTKFYDKLHFNRTSGDGMKPIALLAVSNLSLNTLDIDHKIPASVLPLRRSVKDTSDLRLIGSANGLVCLCRLPYSFTLVNPTTQEFRVVPYPGSFQVSRQPPFRLYAFGYDREQDDFIIFSAAAHHYGSWLSVIKFYSAKAESWEDIPAGVKVPAHAFSSEFSVYVNGVAHWLGWTGFIDPYKGDLLVRKIMGFNFASKEFELLMLDENMDEGEITGLAELGGCICALVEYYDQSLGIWVMEDYGVVESWRKTFSIKLRYASPSAFISPICYADNEILFRIDNEFVFYDPEANTTSELMSGIWTIKKKKGSWLDIVRYEKSIVSP
ncbi:hypothetical protein ACET3Z_020121 [Daucus carota]